jgi:polysaccharide export outer membrane protein
MRQIHGARPWGWGLICVLALGAAASAQNPWQWLKVKAGGAHDDAPAAAPARPAATPPTTAAVPGADYVIGPGDVLAIDVWKEPEISQTEPVRPDGAIAIPLAGTLRAGGSTPSELAAQIKARLAAYISDPVVTVMVTKVVSHSFQVLGEVLRPGSYPLVGPTTVLQALAQAGGFTPFADPGHVAILHRTPDGKQVRYRFDYSAVIHGNDLQQDRLLQPGDSLIVP